MEKIRAFWRSLTEHRETPFIASFEKRLSFLTPSDWFVVAVLGIIMALAAGTLFAAVSVALTGEVPSRNGTYTEGEVGTPRFVNPLLAISDPDRDLTQLVYSGLMKETPDGSLAPDLAASYSVSDDKKTYTFTLKDNAIFDDGTPVTADDVAFTVEEAQNPDIKSPVRADWEGVSVSVLDSKTVSFTLQSPYGPFLANTTLGILPRHLWASVSAEEFPFSTLNANPVGSGPYKVASVGRNSSGIPTEYRLTAFTDGVRVPYIPTFVMKFYDDQDSLTAAFNSGEVQAAYSVDPSAITASHTIMEAPYARVFGVFLNQSQNQIFAEQAVREALDEAVDKQAIVSTVLKGYGSVLDSPLPPTGVSGTLSATTSEDARIASARSLLEKAGWTLGDDGVYQKTTGTGSKKKTERLSFTLSTSNAPELKGAAESAADDWKSLGADVNVQFFDQNDLTTDVIRPRKYDALLFGEVVGRALDLYPFWHSSQRNDPGLNIALYANASVDKLLDAARAEIDPAKREADAESAAKTISEETAAIFLYAPSFAYVVPQNLEGVTLGTLDTPSDRFASVNEWYLSTERVWPLFSMNASELLKKILDRL